MFARALRRRGLLRSLAWSLMGMGILALSLIDASCQQPATMGTAEQSATVDEILANPQRFIGQTVVLDAEVNRVISERVIALESPVVNEEMVVILADQALQGVDSVAANDTIHVVGAVQPLTREQIEQVEQQLGVSLDEDLILQTASQGPFLVALSVTKQ